MSYKFTVKSLKEIEKNTPEWYRANDLLNIMTRKKEEEKESEN
jgi:predicted Zn-dependent protease